MYDVLDVSGLEFRLLQCAALAYDVTTYRKSEGDETPLDESLKALQLPGYAKAFHEDADLVWLLSLRSTYFTLLCTTIQDTICVNEEDGDGDTAFAMARAVLATTKAVASAPTVQADLSSLEQYLLANPEPDAKEAARSGVTQAWATAIQRSAEAEVPGSTVVAAPRTQVQKNLFHQTHLMQLNGKGAADIWALFASECPEAADGISKPNKEEMQRKIATARLQAAKLTEATSLTAVHSQLTQD